MDPLKVYVLFCKRRVEQKAREREGVGQRYEVRTQGKTSHIFKVSRL